MRRRVFIARGLVPEKREDKIIGRNLFGDSVQKQFGLNELILDNINPIKPGGQI